MKPTKKILLVVREALKGSPAYAALVKKKLGTIPRNVSGKNFTRLPLVSKSTFPQRYPLSQLLLHGKRGAVAYASSGSSGTISIWFRDEQSLVDGVQVHRYIFEHIYNIKKNEPTLVLITFSMGIWVAGLFTADVCRALRDHGFAITIATPGIDRKDCLYALKYLAPLFKHVVIAGYPPFVFDFLKEAFHDHKSVPPSVFILTAGDKFSEEWRKEIAVLIQHPNDHTRIIGLYGSADAGAMAFETPFTISIRRAAWADATLAKELFPGAAQLGGLYQYLPNLIHIEESKGELLITKRMPIPLVRYNIHDRGRVYQPDALPHSDVKKNNLPVVSVIGRTDVSVTFYALNIYPEQVDAGILKTVCTGSYIVTTQQRAGKYSERLVIKVELVNGKKPTTKLTTMIARRIFDTLLEVNTEFRKLYDEIGNNAFPQVRLYKKGMVRLPDNNQHPTRKSLIQVSGKKPRILAT